MFQSYLDGHVEYFGFCGSLLDNLKDWTPEIIDLSINQ